MSTQNYLMKLCLMFMKIIYADICFIYAPIRVCVLVHKGSYILMNESIEQDIVIFKS